MKGLCLAPGNNNGLSRGKFYELSPPAPGFADSQFVMVKCDDGYEGHVYAHRFVTATGELGTRKEVEMHTDEKRVPRTKDFPHKTVAGLIQELAEYLNHGGDPRASVIADHSGHIVSLVCHPDDPSARPSVFILAGDGDVGDIDD